MSTDGKAHEPMKATSRIDTAAPKEAPTLAQDERPQWLPEKFKTVEAMLASHQEAEKTLTRQAQELAALKKGFSGKETPPGAPTGSEPSGTEPPASSPPPVAPAPSQTPKLDAGILATEWAANGGKFTDATLARLEAQGIGSDLVMAFIAGQTALAEKSTDALAEVAGGHDQLTRVLQYYGADPARAAFAAPYGQALARGDVASAKLMLRQLVNEYRTRVGRDPRVAITGGEAASMASEEAFIDSEQMRQAIANPLYKTDKLYRRSVERRAFLMRQQRNG